MPTIIAQKPFDNGEPMPAGQDIIFTVQNSLVNTYFNVSFTAEVFISKTPPNLNLSTDLIGTFKTTPNTIGVGMFDFSSVVENHVKADNLCSPFSSYKTTVFNAAPFPPLHLIDFLSFSGNIMRYLAIKFNMQGSTTPTGIPEEIPNQNENSVQYRIFNGYVKHTNKLVISGADFGYPVGQFSPDPIILGGPTSNFVTNAPTTQYANLEDYGTVGVFLPQYQENFDNVKFKYYNSTGGVLGQDIVDTNIISQTNIQGHLVYLGCYPANLRNDPAGTFAGLVTAGTIQGGYYTFEARDTSNNSISKLYTINVNCPDLKNYEPIRLTWLNQWGAWDYYTFTKKSSRTLSTKGSTYTQLEGTWNEKVFRLDGFRGGKKAFRVNATEKIKMNTDFVNESESEWFEELINSPEVYMLEGFQTDITFAMLNTYVTPVRLTTSSYTRKTIANDKLMQYTFEIEKSKTLRTQAI
tara:strand:+ start:1009 stop:2406 length:1398 start_codon:yes stop_codon:yes gene_type:complete